MEITQTRSAYSSPAMAQQGATALSSDFETFLKMLTAQMKNQDPLNPIDSSDYAVQLATFSSVEQQVTTNDLLRGLGAQMGLLGMAQLAGWVGMEARVAAPVRFEGSPITLSPNPLQRAEQTFLVVRNSDGEIVQRSELPVSADPVEWAGVGENGTPFAQGTYSFTLENIIGGEVVATDPVEAYGRVIEARNAGGQIILVFPGGVEVPSLAVTGLRAAG